MDHLAESDKERVFSSLSHGTAPELNHAVVVFLSLSIRERMRLSLHRTLLLNGAPQGRDSGGDQCD